MMLIQYSKFKNKRLIPVENVKNLGMFLDEYRFSYQPAEQEIE